MKLYATSFHAGQKINVEIQNPSLEDEIEADPLEEFDYLILGYEQKRANQESARKKIDLFLD